MVTQGQQHPTDGEGTGIRDLPGWRTCPHCLKPTLILATAAGGAFPFEPEPVPSDEERFGWVDSPVEPGRLIPLLLLPAAARPTVESVWRLHECRPHPQVAVA